MRRAFAVVFAVVAATSLIVGTPALAQEDSAHKRFAGMYEADIPDMGVMGITITYSEDSDTLTIAAEAAPATEMEHIKGNRYKIETYEFGTIYLEFLESEEGDVTSMAIDGYDFSFIAIKTG